MGDVERDVELTSALLNVEKKKRLKALVVVLWMHVNYGRTR